MDRNHTIDVLDRLKEKYSLHHKDILICDALTSAIEELQQDAEIDRSHMNDCWIPTTPINENYLPDERLKNTRAEILITYVTLADRLHVKQVWCEYGRITTKIGGRVIAWMPVPDCYKG